MDKVKRSYTEDVAFSMAIRHQLDRHVPPSGVMTWLSQRVQELEAQVAQLTHEREAARQVIKDGLVAYGMQRGEILRAWVRQAATFLDAPPEGQGDASD
jgi:hypothetical protein